MKIKKMNDSDLLQLIKGKLQWDIRVNNSDLDMNIKGGHVSLRGLFDKAYRHEAVLEIIGSTNGVTKITDESIVVSNYYRTDQELKFLVDEQINTLPLSPGEWINVAVKDGVIRMEGLVFRAQLKAFAARDAWGLSGVQDCINLIEVRREHPSTGYQTALDFFASRYRAEDNPLPYTTLISEF